MNKFFFFFFTISFIISAQSDTITVQSHDQVDLVWNGNYDEQVHFPQSNSYEKILMDFTMGCATGGCSHWDYTISVFLMEPTGSFDSSIVSIDTIEIYSDQVDTTWNVYPIKEKFEIGRLITPYGNYMDWDQPSDPNDLFDDQWTHSYIFDITDFAPLMTDSAATIRVHYGGWSSGFSATVDFHFIEGIPPREVLAVENMYPSGGYSYESLADNLHFPTITKTFTNEVKGFALKTYVSGHGHEGPQNCCEWISKQHSIAVNGDNIYQWNVWKDCGMIPIYPQGGTWPFDRAGWCPGTSVDLQVSEMTDFVDFGVETNFDYNVQAYANNGEQSGTFIVSNTMFSYGAPNFNDDIEIIDIIKPSKKDKWKRMNPICSNPVVELRNRGANYITSAVIEYGVEGQTLSTYEWTGAIEFLQSIQVELPSPDWTGLTQSSNFIAKVILEGDTYLNNNILRSQIVIPEILPSNFIFEFKTQSNYNSVNRAAQSALYLYNDLGELIFEHSSGFIPNTWYRDTLKLPVGCYELVFEDSAENGVNEQWYQGESNTGAGIVRIRELGGGVIKTFPDDFGQQIDLRFTVDFPLESKSLQIPSIQLFPNPAKDILNINLSLEYEQFVELVILNSMGEEIHRRTFNQFISGSEKFDTKGLIPGTYFLKLQSESIEDLRKFVIVE